MAYEMPRINFDGMNIGGGSRSYSTQVPISTPNTAPGSTYANPNPFYSDPVNRYFEDQVKRSVDTVNRGEPGYLGETYDFLKKNIFGAGGGSRSGGGGGGGGNFGDGGIGRFTGYIDSRPGTEASNMFGGYIAGRDADAASSALNSYMSGRDDFAGEFRGYANDRIAQLNEDPFDDTIMGAQRVAAFDALERDRNAMLERAKEEGAAMGLGKSSGVLQKRMGDVHSDFNTQRGQLQNQMVRDRFALIQDNRRQADNLAGMRADFAKAGVGMSDAIRTAAANLQLSELQATDLLQRDNATLTFQERQAKDALEGQLAGLRTQIRGQDTQLAGQRAMAGATSSAARYGAMGSLANFALNRAQLGQDRLQQGVNFAGLFPGLVQGDMGNLQQLFNSLGIRF